MAGNHRGADAGFVGVFVSEVMCHAQATIEKTV